MTSAQKSVHNRYLVFDVDCQGSRGSFSRMEVMSDALYNVWECTNLIWKEPILVYEHADESSIGWLVSEDHHIELESFSEGPSDMGETFFLSTIAKCSEEKPGPPSNIAVSNVSYDHMDVSWEVPAHAGLSPVDRYRIDLSYQNRDGSWSSWSGGVEGGAEDTSASFDDLMRGYVYRFRVSAHNSFGWGASHTVESETLSDPPASVLGPDFGHRTSSGVEVSWLSVTDDGGSPVLEYRLELCTVARSECEAKSKEMPVSTPASSIWGVVCDDELSQSCSVSLGGDQAVSARVAARNKNGWGVSVLVFYGAATVPPTPAAPVVYNITSGSFDVSWAAVECAQKIDIDGYRVEVYGRRLRVANDKPLWWYESEWLEGQRAFVNGLTSGREYIVRVIAHNFAGWSSAGLNTTVSTLAAPPTVLGDLTYSSIGLTWVQLKWTPPTYSSGIPVLGYKVQVKGSDEHGGFEKVDWRTVDCGDVMATRCNVTALEPGKSYHIEARSRNDAGWSKPDDIHVVTVSIPPVSDTAFSLLKGDFVAVRKADNTVLSGSVSYDFEHGKMLVNFADNPESHDVLLYKNGGIQKYTLDTSDNSTWCFNTTSVESPSNLLFVQPEVCPDSNECVVGSTVVNDELSVIWSLFDRVAPEKSLFYIDHESHHLVKFDNARVTVSLTHYTDLVERSSFQDDVTRTCTGEKPGLVQDARASNVNYKSVDIVWQEPKHVGLSPIESYQVEFRDPAGAVASHTWTIAATTFTKPISGLQRGHEYAVRITAYNSFGAGATRSIAFETLSDPPGGLSELSILDRTESTVDVEWNAATTDGGKPITSYQVQMCSHHKDATTKCREANAWQAVCSVDATELTTLDSMTCAVQAGPYITSLLRTAAVNVNGFGYGPVTRLSPAHPPLGPKNITVSKVTTTSFAVSWNAVSSPQHIVVTNYKCSVYGIRLEVDAVPKTYEAAVVDGSITSCNVGELTPGQPYTLRIYAKNFAGWSEQVSSADVSTKQDHPSAISDIAVATMGPHLASLRWDEPYASGLPVLEYKVLELSDSRVRYEYHTQSTQYALTDLQSDTDYTFKVVSRNAIGWSQNGSQLTLHTPRLPETVSYRGMFTANAAVHVFDETFAAHFVYDSPHHLMRADYLNSETQAPESIVHDSSAPDGTLLRYHVTPESATTCYNVTLVEYYHMPVEDLLQMPPTLSNGWRPWGRVDAAGDVIVSWTKWDKDTHREQRVEENLNKRILLSASIVSVVGDDFAISANFTDFKPVAKSTTTAMSGIDDTCNGEKPGPPIDGSAVASYYSASLRWSAPHHAGMGPVTGYHVRMRVQNYEGVWNDWYTPINATDIVTSNALTVSGLTRGKVHEFSVTAVNKYGISAPEVYSTETLADPPRDIAAPEFGRRYATYMKVHWSEPGDNGGSPVEAYQLFVSDAARVVPRWTVACQGDADLLSCELPITTLDSVKVKLSVKNKKGWGHSETVFVDRAYPPAALTGVTVVETDSSSSTWKLSGMDPWASLLVTLTQTCNNVVVNKTWAEPIPEQIHFTHLVPGCRYVAKVYQKNFVGLSPPLEVETTTDEDVPLTLPVISVSDTTTSSFVVHLDDSAVTDIIPITKYRIQMAAVYEGDSWSTLYEGDIIDKFNVVDLKSGGQYRIRLYSRNRVGWSKPSEVVVHDVFAEPPAKVTGVKVVSMGPRWIVLQWSTPSFSSYLDITEYRIHTESESAGEPISIDATTTMERTMWNHNVTVTAGTYCEIQVQAKSSAGWGEGSDVMGLQMMQIPSAPSIDEEITLTVLETDEGVDYSGIKTTVTVDGLGHRMRLDMGDRDSFVLNSTLDADPTVFWLHGKDQIAANGKAAQSINLNSNSHSHSDESHTLGLLSLSRDIRGDPRRRGLVEHGVTTDLVMGTVYECYSQPLDQEILPLVKHVALLFSQFDKCSTYVGTGYEPPTDTSGTEYHYWRCDLTETTLEGQSTTHRAIYAESVTGTPHALSLGNYHYSLSNYVVAASAPPEPGKFFFANETASCVSLDGVTPNELQPHTSLPTPYHKRTIQETALVSSDGGGGADIGMIAGIVGGVVGVSALIALIVVKKRNRGLKPRPKDYVEFDFEMS
eukprot:GFYU01002349.1.p1 GENE.GFYU01002349.1~~GFYU01002349.1.p1  ORF type:complete len:2304 (+),score=385.50 GFYU01002349.1:628-6912(+)